ncbi:hypothetical protein GCM10023189_24670 [Nibrella saemangeumensis]|uniref:Sugar phosphate isomerase/epimerase n=1 Tax=Nibrella saemangeumensis TaxID=1084526 RepID=A0ABP8MVC8_9BACT
MIVRIWILAISLISYPLLAQQNARLVRNPFFTLHNGIRGDSIYNTPARQVKLAKELGYDGMEINQLESFPAFKAEMDRQGLPVTCVYFKVDLDEPTLDVRLPEYIRSLRNSGTILLPYVISSKKTYAPSDTKGDSVAVRR